MMKRHTDFEKFKQEYKKDFDIPVLSAKEKDIFMYLFLLLRRKIGKGIFPELYNSEIMFSKSDLKALILKNIVIFQNHKKGWTVSINPYYITKNVECSFCGAKFNEIVYFRQNRITCPGCGLIMHDSIIAKRVDDYSKAITNTEKLTTDIVKVPNEHVITDIPSVIKVTDIVLAPTAMERTIQIANEEVIPFRIGPADKLNALSTLKRIENKKKEAKAIVIQDNILANFSPMCVNLLKEYFFIQHTFFSARKYINLKLTEISKDPRFIANASLKGNTLTEVKNACELLCESAEIRSVTIAEEDKCGFEYDKLVLFSMETKISPSSGKAMKMPINTLKS